MRIVHQRFEARRDLVEIIAYFAERGSSAARRFRLQAEATFNRLADQPGLGTPYDSDDPTLAGLRYAIISKFRNYVAFYRPTPDGIEIVRVLHGSRDLTAILMSDLGDDEDGEETTGDPSTT